MAKGPECLEWRAPRKCYLLGTARLRQLHSFFSKGMICEEWLSFRLRKIDVEAESGFLYASLLQSFWLAGFQGTMTIRLRPRDEQIQELKQISAIGAAKLLQVAERLNTVGTPLHKPDQLASLIRPVVGAGASELLVRQLFSLRGLVRRFGTNAADIINSLREYLVENSVSGVLQEADWKSFSQAFCALLECKSICISATANELSYDYANLIRSIRLLSDIRPLYNDSADEIEGAVISHTMRLQYDSADGEHELSLALDEQDIAKLMKQCERALKKSVAAKKLMTEKAGVPAFLSGQVPGAVE
jgi:hypothetical protein